LNKIKNILSLIGVAVAALALIFFLGYYEVSIWGECLQTNSVWYCMRVLSA